MIHADPPATGGPAATGPGTPTKAAGRQPRVTIVSASDETYAPLLDELIGSVRAHAVLDDIDLSILSTGMSDETKARLRPRVQTLVDGRWDIAQAGHKARGRTWLMGRVAKLFIREHVPGYDLYIWIDADAWVCDPAAIGWLIEGARQSGLAIAPDELQLGDLPVGLRRGLFGPVARTYTQKHLRRAGMPNAVIRAMATRRPLNNGVFALTADAPHWDAIQGHMERLVRKGRIVGTNQIAVMMAVYLDGLPMALMPQGCNYMDLPRVCADTGALVEAIIPHRRVGILHLANRDEARRNPAHRERLLDTRGQPVLRSLRFQPSSSSDSIASRSQIGVRCADAGPIS